VEADSTGAFEMSLRAVQGELPPSYRPEYLRSPGTDINVPALTFVASTGTRGWVNSNYPLETAKWVSEKGVDWIADPEAKAFLKRLASDEELQRRVRASWKENVVPALRENEKAFKQAFGEDLRVVKLDVPFVSGYQYKNAPASIEPHIRTFLKELRARESAQPPAPTVDHHLHMSSESAASALERIVKNIRGEDINQEPIPADSVIQILDAAGIENGVLLSAAYFFGSPFIDVTDAYAKVKAENDYVAREASKYPERLIAFCSFNPLADYALKEITRCSENADITGVKLHLANAQFDFRNTEHVRALKEVFQEAARLGLPIVIHLGTGPDYGYRDARIFIDEVLASAPDGTVQIAHMAGGGSPPVDSARKSPMQAFVDASAEQPGLMEENVVFDLSGAFRSPAGHEGDTLRTIQAFNERLARHIQDIGVDHVVFGSDWPALPEPGRSAETLRSILDQKTVESLFDNRAPYVR
jgi:predicted TIM-barrel fold metal-dependent hydrolase